jgi:hypothetical protein
MSGLVAWKAEILIAMSQDAALLATDFRVAARLLDHANVSTRDCYPSHQTIADEIGLTERGVRASVARLRASGWLTVTKGKLPKGPGKANYYRFHNGDHRHPGDGEQPDHRHENGGEHDDHRHSHATTTGITVPPKQGRGNRKKSPSDSLFGETAETGNPKLPKKRTPKQALEAVLSEAMAEAVVDYRRGFKAPFTTYAAQLLAERYARARDTCGLTPEQAANFHIESGWQGFKPEWVRNAMQRDQRAPAATNGGQPKSIRDEMLEIAARQRAEESAAVAEIDARKAARKEGKS